MIDRTTLLEVRAALKATITTYPYQRCIGKAICKGCRAQIKAVKALAKIDAILNTDIEDETGK